MSYDHTTKIQSPELTMVAEFLRQSLPFNLLPEQALVTCCEKIVIQYETQGTLIQPGQQQALRIIRSGAVDLLCGYCDATDKRYPDGQPQLLDRLGESEHFNLEGLAETEPQVHARTIEDTLFYNLPLDMYEALRAEYRDFDRYFHRQRARRLRRASREQIQQAPMIQPLHAVMTTELLTVNAELSIAEVAQKMTARGCSSALILIQEKLKGIITDRDLRSRVLAQGIPATTAVSDVMTCHPVTINADRRMFDAMLLMSEHRIHHLPVLQHDETLAGIVTLTDVLRSKQNDPLLLAHQIAKCKSVEALTKLLEPLPKLFVEWQQQGSRADQITRLLTLICDSVTRRLVSLAQAKLGEPPCEFAWLAFGSQGREEIFLGSDQDNALVYSDSGLADPAMRKSAEHYFYQLADFVCAGLNQCGYVFCQGGIMASNPQWCLPLSQWKKTIVRWGEEPTSEAVMRVCIFFDIRCVSGSNVLTLQLQECMQSVARSDIFLAVLAKGAQSHRPPLGFFRQFVLTHNGNHKHQLNLKHQGVVPLIDLVRVRALANGVADINTLQRLHSLTKQGHITLRDARNLEDAWRILQRIRMEHLAAHVSAGAPLDHFIDPSALSDLQRQQLKDAFALIVEAQKVLSMHFEKGY